MSKCRAVGLDRWSAGAPCIISITGFGRNPPAPAPARRQVDRYEQIATPTFGARLHIPSSLIKENLRSVLVQSIGFEAGFLLARSAS